MVQLVGGVGFDFLVSHFPGFEPWVGVLFSKSRFGGSGFTSGSGGGPVFILGFCVFHFWFPSNLVPHAPWWLSRLGVRFVGGNVVGSNPGRGLFFQHTHRVHETCRFSFPGTSPCIFLKDFHSLARRRAQFHSLARRRVFSLRNARVKIHSLARRRFFGRPRTRAKMVVCK